MGFAFIDDLVLVDWLPMLGKNAEFLLPGESLPVMEDSPALLFEFSCDRQINRMEK